MRRRLAAIMFADVAGYSRLIGQDEPATLGAFQRCLTDIWTPRISAHDGRIVKTTGDGLLAEFDSAVAAVRCALDVQEALHEDGEAAPVTLPAAANGNSAYSPLARSFRIGINLGEVVVEENDIYGIDVNIAARLQAVAEPGGICVSAAVHNATTGRLPFVAQERDSQVLKNIEQPIRCFAIRAPGVAAEARPAQTSRLELPDRPSIAVLAFDNMSGDPDQEYLSDGISEDIITALSRLRWFFVIARNSSFTYKGRPVDIKRVARELGVRYVLEGSARRCGSRLRINAQLIDATSGAHIWAQRYEREVTDIFAVQDEITESVVGSIEPEILANEGTRSQLRPAESLDAWELLMRAVMHWQRMTKADSNAAIDLLQQAIARFPDYAQAHSLLAMMCLVSGHMSWVPPLTVGKLAEACARRAALLDNGDPWAHLALGYLAFIARDTDRAVGEYRVALELNANFAAASGYLGMALAFAGRGDEAIPHLERAIRLSPRDAQTGIFYGCVGVAHYLAGRYAVAVEWTRRGVQLLPEFVGCQRIHAACLAQFDQLDEARRVFAEVKRLQPDINADWIRRHIPYVGDINMDHFLAGLYKAGLPRG